MALAALTALVLALPADGKKSSSSGYKSHHSSHSSPGVARDSSGKIKRDPGARRGFQKSHPCPSTGKTSGACPGYVVDHVMSFERGGGDSPSNMQSQTRAAAKVMDKWEQVTSY